MTTRRARVAIATGALAAGGLALTAFAWSTNTIYTAGEPAPTATSTGGAATPAGPSTTAGNTPGATPLGHTLFLSQGCARCHDGPESQAVAEVAPSLADAPAWAAERRPGLSAEAYLQESIRTPGAFISPAFTPNGPTTAMPGFTLSDAEVEALVAYLLAPS